MKIDAAYATVSHCIVRNKDNWKIKFFEANFEKFIKLFCKPRIYYSI